MSIRPNLARLLAATLAVLSWSGLAQPTLAQEGLAGAADPRVGYSETVAVQWVGVPIELPTLAGTEPLGAESFQLSIDGRPVPIHDFEGPVAEIALLYVQDISGSMGLAGKLDQSREIYAALIGALSEDDELGVLTFGDFQTTLTVPLAVPDHRHREQATSWKGWGKTAIRDALLQAPDLARQSRRARTAIVLVTDGNDNASQISSEQLQAVLQASAVPLYLFDLSADAADAATNDTAPRNLSEIDSLSALARASGGATFLLTDRATAEYTARALVQRLSHQYWLTFPADPSTPTAAHTIQVALRSPSGADPRRRNPSSLATSSMVRHRSHYLGGAPLLDP